MAQSETGVYIPGMLGCGGSGREKDEAPAAAAAAAADNGGDDVKLTSEEL